MFQQCQLYPQLSRQDLLSQFQIQRTICSQYIKIASSQLHIQQAQTISTANDLLQKISAQPKVKDLSEWDVFTTRDSVVIEELSSINLSGISHQSRGKPIQRKAALTSRTNKDNQQSLNQYLAEVERQCSYKTSARVRKVVEQYKKLKGRVFELQKKEKGMKLKQKIIEDLQQKNVILSNKIEELQRVIAKNKTDFASLKNENSELIEEIRKKTDEINSERKIKIYEEIISHQHSSGKKEQRKSITNNVSYDVLTNLIEQKEHLFTLRYSQVKCLQQKIQKQLFSEENRCLGCCAILKKVKNSILAYKKYLEQEGLNFEEMVDKFKQKLLDQSMVNS